MNKKFFKWLQNIIQKFGWVTLGPALVFYATGYKTSMGFKHYKNQMLLYLQRISADPALKKFSFMVIISSIIIFLQ